MTDTGNTLNMKSDYKVGKAIRSIEMVEDELNEEEGMEEIRERLSEARRNLVDGLIERELND